MYRTARSVGIASSPYLLNNPFRYALICVGDPREHLIDQKWRQSMANLNRLVERGVITSGGTVKVNHSFSRASSSYLRMLVAQSM